MTTQAEKDAKVAEYAARVKSAAGSLLSNASLLAKAVDLVVEEPTPRPEPERGFFLTVQVAGNDARRNGTAFDKNDLYRRVATALGRDLGGRGKFFDGTRGIQATLAEYAATTLAHGDPEPSMCFKAYTEAQLRARLDVLTRPEVWVWEQEFYSTSSSEWATYNRHYETLRKIRDAHPNGRLVTLQMVSDAYPERNQPGHFTQADVTLVDEWGADSYSPVRGKPYAADYLFGNQATAFEQMKARNPDLRWVISEYGIPRWKSFGPDVLHPAAERLAYLTGHLEWLAAHGCSGITYWAVDNHTASEPIKDWSIDKGTPEDAGFARGVAALMARYPLVTA